MGIDKAKLARRTGKSTDKNTQATRIEDNASVTSLSVVAMRASVTAILDNIESQDKAQDMTGQQLVRLVGDAYKAYVATATNLTKIAAIHDMIDAQHKLTEGGTHFAKNLKADWLGKRISAPSVSQSIADPDAAGRASRYAADAQSIDRAVKAFIAASVHGGKVNATIWDEGQSCLLVPSSNFLPAHDPKTEQPFRFLDTGTPMPELVPLTGRFYNAFQPAAPNTTAKPEPADGKFTMTNLLRTFYAKPTQPRTAQQQDKGADQKDATQLDAKIKAAALKGADFFELLNYLHGIMKADKDTPITLADVDQHKNAMEAMRSIALLYGKLTTEAEQRVNKSAAA